MNEIILGDCCKEMRSYRFPTPSLIFADPPYNIGYGYDEHDDNMPSKEYLVWSAAWITRCFLSLHEHGSMFVLIGDEYAAEIKKILDGTGMDMRNWIIWYYTFGQNCKKKFNRCHAHLLYYVKNPKYFTFNAESILVPSARTEKYNDKRGAAGGKLPDDVWQMSRLCGTFKERTKHPCQLPEQLLERIIRVASNPGDIVLDPFCGSGTTPAVAKRLGRRYIAIEKSAAYVAAARKRLDRVKPAMEVG